MTERMIKFPSIEQYRNVVRAVHDHTRYVGKDEDGNPVFDGNIPLPTLLFRGTVKLHGTNASVVRDTQMHTWTQSRENVITPMKDNAGFAAFAHSTRDVFQSMFDAMDTIMPATGDQVHAIFGEWCGAGIQKKVGIAQLPKMFVVCAMARVNEEGLREWYNPADICNVFSVVGNQIPTTIKHIYQFPTFFTTIDFNKPGEYTPILEEITLDVEKRCPVAAALGATEENGPMTGEGVVWQCVDPGWTSSRFWFKVKGEEHAAKSKEPKKQLAPAEVERFAAIAEMAASLTPGWRLEQMYQQTFDTLNGGTPDIKRMGDYIKNVIADVVKEELDTITANGYTVKEISSPISKLAREYMLTELNKFSS